MTREMRRTLVLFAREPGRQARDKGFPGPEAAELFAGAPARPSSSPRRPKTSPAGEGVSDRIRV
jgi:hypothetical protein